MARPTTRLVLRIVTHVDGARALSAADPDAEPRLRSYPEWREQGEPVDLLTDGRRADLRTSALTHPDYGGPPRFVEADKGLAGLVAGTETKDPPSEATQSRGDFWLSTALSAGFVLICGGACHLLGWWWAAQRLYPAAGAILLVRLLERLGRHVQRRRSIQRTGSRRVLGGWLVGTLLALMAMLSIMRYADDDAWGVIVLVAVALVFFGCVVAATLEAERIEQDRATFR
ncbi:hypothetical protein ACFSX1_28550 [Micromonospora eburnea]